MACPPLPPAPPHPAPSAPGLSCRAASSGPAWSAPPGGGGRVERGWWRTLSPSRRRRGRSRRQRRKTPTKQPPDAACWRPGGPKRHWRPGDHTPRPEARARGPTCGNPRSPPNLCAAPPAPGPTFPPPRAPEWAPPRPPHWPQPPTSTRRLPTVEPSRPRMASSASWGSAISTKPKPLGRLRGWGRGVKGWRVGAREWGAALAGPQAKAGGWPAAHGRRVRGEKGVGCRRGARRCETHPARASSLGGAGPGRLARARPPCSFAASARVLLLACLALGALQALPGSRALGARVRPAQAPSVALSRPCPQSPNGALASPLALGLPLLPHPGVGLACPCLPLPLLQPSSTWLAAPSLPPERSSAGAPSRPKAAHGASCDSGRVMGALGGWYRRWASRGPRHRAPMGARLGRGGLGQRPGLGRRGVGSARPSTHWL
jgi:hypothetical protein